MFGRRLDPWTHVVLVGSAVSLVGCTDRVIDRTPGAEPAVGSQVPVPGPPQLIDVRFLDDRTLQLTYSEPMADPMAELGPADPSAFRLSVGVHYHYRYRWRTYDGTYYSDLSYFSGTISCQQLCYDDTCYDYCYGAQGLPIEPVGLSAVPDDATRIRLALDNPVTTGVCTTIESLDALPEFRAGLFLHYTDDRAGVADSTGELAAPLAEHWVVSGDVYTYLEDQTFAALRPFLPIPCDF